jgi:hypothetical protein
MKRIAIALPLLLSACFVARGDGEALSEIRPMGELKGISNSCEIEVEVELGLEQSVEVLCDSNLVPRIVTELDGQILEVRTTPGSWLQPETDCTVFVSAPGMYSVRSSGSGGVRALGAALGLEDVRNSGSGLVEIEGIDTEALEAENSGSGGITLAGTAGFVELRNTGSGGIDARDLVAESGDVHNSGSGTIELTVEGSVDVRLSGSGDVVLSGDPELSEQNDSGSGDIVLR